MRSPVFRRNATIAIGLLSLATVFFVRDDIEAIALPSRSGDLDDAVLLANVDLPRALADGSVLEAVERKGDAIIYRQQEPQGFSHQETYRHVLQERCELWRRHLRRGAVSVVETRYQGSGSSSSFYLRKAQCG